MLFFRVVFKVIFFFFMLRVYISINKKIGLLILRIEKVVSIIYFFLLNYRGEKV